MTDQKRYYKHINGLKGLACILVMLGHYVGLYKYAQDFPISYRLLDWINSSVFSFLLDEGYWLYLFFVASGFLVSQSRVSNLKEGFFKSVIRFFRLAFPIFFSYLLIFLIYKFVGFHAQDTASVFQCDWLQEYYKGRYKFLHVLESPFAVLIQGKITLNPPYWVLKSMFIASIIIYFLKSLYVTFRGKINDVIMFLCMIGIIIALYWVSPIISACLIGMLITVYEESGLKDNQTFGATMIISILIVMNIIPETMKSSVFFALLLLLVPRINIVNLILSSKFMQFTGNISWGIYSFHWPVLCSVGLLMLIKVVDAGMGLQYAYPLSVISAALLTIALSVIFAKTFEPLSSYLTKKIKTFLDRYK